MKILSDDGTEFDSVEACLSHEATLPYIKLLADVDDAVKADAAFAGKIEALGTRLARDRRERGEMRRTRASKGDTPDPTPPLVSPSSEATPRQSGESGDGFVESSGVGRDEACGSMEST